MRFDEGLAFFISAVIGAGVFALPVLANQVSPFYVLISITIALLFGVFLGYTILNLAPAEIEEEVERVLGKKARIVFHLFNLSIILLALTAYCLALQEHLKTSLVILLFLLFIPLFFNVTFPAAFSVSLAVFILLFLGIISLSNLSFLETVKLSTSNIFLPPFIAAAYFAFFGHNIIPRIRNIVRNLREVKEIVLEGLLLAFLVYLPFTLSTAYLGKGEIATILLSKIYKEPASSIIALIAVLIFYTSFILFGLHLQDMLPPNKFNPLLIVGITSMLYWIVKRFSIGFPILIASAGFVVCLWSLIVSIVAFKVRKGKDLLSQVSPGLTAFLSTLPFILLIFYH